MWTHERSSLLVQRGAAKELIKDSVNFGTVKVRNLRKALVTTMPSWCLFKGMIHHTFKWATSLI